MGTALRVDRGQIAALVTACGVAAAAWIVTAPAAYAATPTYTCDTESYTQDYYGRTYYSGTGHCVASDGAGEKSTSGKAKIARRDSNSYYSCNNVEAKLPDYAGSKSCTYVKP
ncbi:hypothetical protein [Nocardia sp. NPDC050175]|uniref:hypothetical protein n=1 Tax=Nocardia sp. NPDC050175 TaxID=3364317 RepID=UPI0037874672